jgi:hypothetical protein
VVWKRPPRELDDSLQEQLSALRVSCASYDAGNAWEAKRLASTIHILVHDRPKRVISLLTQLGKKEGLRFISSAVGFSETSLTTQMPLVMIQAGSEGAVFKPMLGLGPFPPAALTFAKWWDEPILREKQGRTLSRKNLVFSLRNQDGGGHIDSELTDQGYVSVSRQNGASLFYGSVDALSPVEPGPHLASMRQVAWEVEQSIANLDQNGKDTN